MKPISEALLGIPKLLEMTNEIQVAMSLVHVLDESLDWYILYRIRDNDLEIIYRNKPVRDKFESSECSAFGSHCFEFQDLHDIILEVYHTKEQKLISNYVTSCKCQNNFKFLNIQIYRNNGHVVLCARDMTEALSENAKALRLANKKLDNILQGTNK